MNARSISISIALIAGILLFANLLADAWFVRVDFTEDKEFTLSQATRDVLAGLEVPVTVKAYYSGELPIDLEEGRKQLDEMLAEYARFSGDMVLYTFIHPMESDELQAEAAGAGVSPQMVTLTNDDRVSQQVAFFGAVVEVGEEQEAIPVILPNGPLEFQLTSAIKKLSVLEKPAIGILQGHGEQGVQQMPQIAAALDVQYTVEPVTLEPGQPVPDHIKALAILNPQDTIAQPELAQLDAFLARGGGLYIAFNRVQAELNQGMGQEQRLGIADWLRSKGVRVDPAFVADVQCGAISVQQPTQFGFALPMQISFPYFPVVENYGSHPAGKGIGRVGFQFVSPVYFEGDSSQVKFTPLARTSEQSAVFPAPTYFDYQKQWAVEEFPESRVAVAAALEGPLAGAANARMIVVADGDFCMSGRQGMAPDNVNMVVNGLDWLADESGLIDLRARGIKSRPLKAMEDGTRQTVKYLNFLLPMLLVIGYGLLRMQARKSQRNKRQAADFGSTNTETSDNA